MTHDQFKELLHLSFYQELDEDQAAVLSKHVEGCSGCRLEFEELEKYSAAISHSSRAAITDQLLDEARRELRVALRLERSKRTFGIDWLERIDILRSPGFRIAFGTVATLIIGLSIGYFVFSPTGSNAPLGTFQTAVGNASRQQEEPRVSDFHIIQQPAEDGSVEFTFDMVTPVRLRGNINDSAIQRVMAQALVSAQNPGTRLRTISALANQVEPMKASDKEIKAALIQAFKTDGNVGVRKEALKALQRFPLDEDVKEALLFVLKHEANAGVRIDVINFLEKPLQSHELKDEDFLSSLKERMQLDKNNYIRNRANIVYKEAKQ